MLNENLNNVSVVGASGKMGSGISLLLLQELTRLSWSEENDARKDLFLVDRNQDALDGLKSYLKKQVTRYAEKNITWIKKEVAQDDQEQIDAFVAQALKITNFSTDLGVVKGSSMVFEAIFERLDIKTQLLKDLKKICPGKTNFFSNTSSIPISIVEKSAGVEGRLIGFHFYNPPAVQKLVELISSEKTPQHLQQISLELGERLNKVMVPSNDIAGFIGNGHFIRDGLFGISEVEKLSIDFESHEGIYIINQVTQNMMIRPMGIFQLIDYVGLDVFQMILNTMNFYIEKEDLSSQLISQLIDAGVSGGQNYDGSQKNGFIQYENHKPVAIYNIKEKKYISYVEGDWKDRCDQFLGDLPENHVSWKELSRDKEKDQKLASYFQSLFSNEHNGARISQKYLLNSKKISQNLVKDCVAHSSEDVGKVLMNGFFHLYPPENNMF